MFLAYRERALARLELRLSRASADAQGTSPSPSGPVANDSSTSVGLPPLLADTVFSRSPACTSRTSVVGAEKLRSTRRKGWPQPRTLHGNADISKRRSGGQVPQTRRETLHCKGKKCPDVDRSLSYTSTPFLQVSPPPPSHESCLVTCDLRETPRGLSRGREKLDKKRAAIACTPTTYTSSLS